MTALFPPWLFLVQLKLDDKGMNTQEYWEKQVLFACRQNQPAGYGFYFPAVDDHEDEDTLTSKMVCICYSVTPIELCSYIGCSTKYQDSLFGNFL